MYCILLKLQRFFNGWNGAIPQLFRGDLMGRFCRLDISRDGELEANTKQQVISDLSLNSYKCVLVFVINVESRTTSCYGSQVSIIICDVIRNMRGAGQPVSNTRISHIHVRYWLHWLLGLQYHPHDKNRSNPTIVKRFGIRGCLMSYEQGWF